MASATVVPAPPAHAQIPWHTIDIWKSYRREDLGFEVEMPGDPEIDEEMDEDGHSIHVEFLFIGMMLGVEHTVMIKREASIARLIRHHHNVAQMLEGKVMREAPFTMDGLPAIEIVSDLKEGFVSIARAVVMGNRYIMVNVVGGPDIAANPSALRFLNSFKLLPGVRKAE